MESVTRNTFWSWEYRAWRLSGSLYDPLLFPEHRSLWPLFLNFSLVSSPLLELSRALLLLCPEFVIPKDH